MSVGQLDVYKTPAIPAQKQFFLSPSPGTISKTQNEKISKFKLKPYTANMKLATIAIRRSCQHGRRCPRHGEKGSAREARTYTYHSQSFALYPILRAPFTDSVPVSSVLVTLRIAQVRHAVMDIHALGGCLTTPSARPGRWLV